MSEEIVLFLEDGEGRAGLWDICKWWIYTYPEDIFVNEPKEIVAIRDLMKILLAKRKGATEVKERDE